MTTQTFVTALADTGLIRFAGEDAQAFLHGQLSCDVAALQIGCATYGSYNTPKGRMLATFLLWRDDNGYLMQLPGSLREPIQKRLAMYILRSKVKATDVSGEYALFGLAGTAAQTALTRLLLQNIPSVPLTMTTGKDISVLRLAADRFEIIAAAARAHELTVTLAKTAAFIEASVWNGFDIRAGIPHILPATQEQLVPQMANLDLIGGVSFSKGCYPGQEIVARMHYLGRLKQRMYLANIVTEDAPLPGDKLYGAEFGDQACGTIVNAAPAPGGGYDVLASIQIESANRGNVHFTSAAGPVLQFLDLPYKY